MGVRTSDVGVGATGNVCAFEHSVLIEGRVLLLPIALHRGNTDAKIRDA